MKKVGDCAYLLNLNILFITRGEFCWDIPSHNGQFSMILQKLLIWKIWEIPNSWYEKLQVSKNPQSPGYESSDLKNVRTPGSELASGPEVRDGFNFGISRGFFIPGIGICCNRIGISRQKSQLCCLSKKSHTGD